MTATRRPYTGFDKIGRRRPGVEAFAAQLRPLTDGMLISVGTFGIRPMRGKTSISVHATGRAIDVSYQTPAAAGAAWEIFDRMLEHADELGLEAVGDYRGAKRWWRCDRNGWKAPAVVYGSPVAVHFEFSPEAADDPKRIVDVFAQCVNGNAVSPLAPPKYPGRPLSHGSTGKAVAAIQTALGVVSDGKYGPLTEAAVIAYQHAHDLEPDGIVGPLTWASFFG